LPEEDDADAVASAITSVLLPPPSADPIDRIVRATLEVVADEGVAAATFDRVAERASMAPTVLEAQFEDVDHLLRVAFERSGAAVRELIESVDRPDDAVHLIIPALATQSPYTRALTRAILDGYGIDTVQRSFPLADHLVDALTRLRDEKGAGVIDPRVAAASIVTLAGAWHFNAAFVERAYGLGGMDEVAVRRQLSTVLEGIVNLVTGPRLT
jgi:AcrR family transcriptional regulator